MKAVQMSFMSSIENDKHVIAFHLRFDVREICLTRLIGPTFS